MEQLKVGTNDLPLMAKKKVAAAAASVSSTEAFPTTGLTLQLEGCPQWRRPVSLAGRWGRSATTLTWMIGWRRWRPVSSWRWQWRPRRRLPDYVRPSPRHHVCWTIWEPCNMKVWLVHESKFEVWIEKGRELYLWSVEAWGRGIVGCVRTRTVWGEACGLHKLR
jgi:hypothetical protein